jgi:hypothetical protein
MKKYKFEKPFSAFSSNEKTLKDHWKNALHDPAYLLLLGGLILFLIIFLH